MARVTTKKIVSKRGELWTCDLRPGVGYEVTKKRPCLVISSDEINKHASTIIVLPFSSQMPRILGPERIFVPSYMTGLQKDSVILAYQIRSIDKTRLFKKIGRLSEEKLFEIENALRLVLEL